MNDTVSQSTIHLDTHHPERRNQSSLDKQPLAQQSALSHSLLTSKPRQIALHQSDSQPLIFTERRLLPKLMDSLLTCIAWLGFIWLIYHGVRALLQAQPQIGISSLGLTFNTLTLYLLIALGNSFLLILWAKYNQRRFRIERRTRPQALPDEQLTCHFGLTPQVLAQLSQSQIVVVHHNHDGSALEVSVRR